MATTDRQFDRQFEKLPDDIKPLVIAAINNPYARQYRIKKYPAAKGKVRRKNTYRIRVTDQEWRAMAEKVGNEFVWYFVGDHKDYDRASK